MTLKGVLIISNHCTLVHHNTNACSLPLFACFLLAGLSLACLWVHQVPECPHGLVCVRSVKNVLPLHRFVGLPSAK
jgi:hypothetical protein